MDFAAITGRRVTMPPRGVKGKKNARQYEKIKASAKKSGRSIKTAKRIAAATVNKRRASEKRSRAAKKGRKGGGKKR
jgi:hypothetical protein